jgi:hypothetical protein
VCGCSRLKNFCSAVVSYVALALPSDGKRDGEGGWAFESGEE